MPSPRSPQPLQDEEKHESDVVNQDSFPLFTIIEEAPNESYQDLTKPQNPPFNDPNNPEEDEEDEKAEGEVEELEQETLEVNPAISSGMSARDVKQPSPHSIFGFCGNKRKKGKGKGKLNTKKQQMLEKKMESLMKNLNPVPFTPKMLDFPKHEKLLRKLGLWDFVNIDFDRKLRQDLIAQLVATYESRCSYVNGSRIGVNRADLARAFKMPTKKEKVVQVDLDFEPLSDESIAFMLGFVSDWVLLHEDTWMMPNEVMNWIKVIKGGHPEKVDWAGLIWFMVEKELIQGEKLEDCYYASHLQHLIKEQKVFLKEELTAEAKEMEDVYVKVDGPSIELTLGQDSENEEKMKDVEMMYFENCEESDEDGRGDEEEGQWLMQSCNAENSREIGGFEDRKVEHEGLDLEGDEEAGEKFHDFPNDDTLGGDGLTGNFLQTLDGHMQLNNFPDNYQINSSHVGASSLDLRTDMQQQMVSPRPFFKQAGKREIIQHDGDDDVISDSDRNKRLRINDSWDNNKPADFETCLDSIQQITNKARMLYEEKEQALEQSNMNQQILLNELQKRENLIEMIHAERYEEMQKKDELIYRYERELFLMGNVLEGYRKALKDIQKKFAEYRQKAQLQEEPAYKDTGPGGLMLSTEEIERIQKKEEEHKMNCLIAEEIVKEAEECFTGQFDGFLEKVKMLDQRLAGLEGDAKELIGLYVKQKLPRIDKPEVAEPTPSDEIVELPANV